MATDDKIWFHLTTGKFAGRSGYIEPKSHIRVVFDDGNEGSGFDFEVYAEHVLKALQSKPLKCVNPRCNTIATMCVDHALEANAGVGYPLVVTELDYHAAIEHVVGIAEAMTDSDAKRFCMELSDELREISIALDKRRK